MAVNSLDLVLIRLNFSSVTRFWMIRLFTYFVSMQLVWSQSLEVSKIKKNKKTSKNFGHLLQVTVVWSSDVDRKYSNERFLKIVNIFMRPGRLRPQWLGVGTTCYQKEARSPKPLKDVKKCVFLHPSFRGDVLWYTTISYVAF